jgi:hypothetical protein
VVVTSDSEFVIAGPSALVNNGTLLVSCADDATLCRVALSDGAVLHHAGSAVVDMAAATCIVSASYSNPGVFLLRPAASLSLQRSASPAVGVRELQLLAPLRVGAGAVVDVPAGVKLTLRSFDSPMRGVINVATNGAVDVAGSVQVDQQAEFRGGGQVLLSYGTVTVTPTVRTFGSFFGNVTLG